MNGDHVRTLLTTWNKITVTIVSTAAAITVALATVQWFQPRAVAQQEHAAIIKAHDESAAQQKQEATRDALEAELERIKLALKFYAQIQSARDLTADEQLEYEYLRERHRQVITRLYANRDEA